LSSINRPEGFIEFVEKFAERFAFELTRNGTSYEG
jgi:hypothetical protein